MYLSDVQLMFYRSLGFKSKDKGFVETISPPHTFFLQHNIPQYFLPPTTFTKIKFTKIKFTFVNLIQTVDGYLTSL